MANGREQALQHHTLFGVTHGRSGEERVKSRAMVVWSDYPEGGPSAADAFFTA